jgi:hypothetical protein
MPDRRRYGVGDATGVATEASGGTMVTGASNLENRLSM